MCAIPSLANGFIRSFEEHVGAVAGLQKLFSRLTGSKHGCAEHTSGYLQSLALACDRPLRTITSEPLEVPLPETENMGSEFPANSPHKPS